MEFNAITTTDGEKQLIYIKDKDKLLTELAEQTAKYNALVVTEDGIKAAKQDRAKLNKLKTLIDERRKEIKKECLKPYEDFEAEVKEVLELLDKPIENIDKQVAAFDEREKTEKKAELERFFRNNAGDLLDIVAFDRIFNPKWLNKTVTLLAATQEIVAKIEEIRNGLTAISQLNSKFELQVKAKYFETLNLAMALSENSRLEEAEKALAKTDFSVKQAPQAQTSTQTAPATPTSGAKAEEVKTIKVIFHDTTSDFRAEMKALTEKHNIKYGGI